jgi:cell division protein FtsW
MPDRIIYYTVIILLTGGVVFTYSLSFYATVNFHVGEFTFATKQFLFASLSIVTMWILSRLNPDVWIHKIGMTFFIGGLITIVAMEFLPSSIVPPIGGATRWIKIGPLSIAPVEFYKIGFVYFLAWSMSRKIDSSIEKPTLMDELQLFLPYILIFLISILFIGIGQKDLGQTMLLSFSFLILAFFAGGSRRFFSLGLSGLFIVFIIFSISQPHRVQRLLSWWGGVQEPIAEIMPDFMRQYIIFENTESQFQVSQALSAISNGGLTGQGLGNGIFKYGYLPEVHTDFILEGVAEELGFLSIVVILTMFLILIQRILKVANRSKEPRFMLFGIGIAVVIGLGLLINTYGATGLLPMKGLPVPFISYGGSAILALSIGIGMILMISKQDFEEEKESFSESLEPSINRDEYDGVNLLREEREIEYVDFEHDGYFEEYEKRRDQRNAYSRHPEF